MSEENILYVGRSDKVKLEIREALKTRFGHHPFYYDIQLALGESDMILEPSERLIVKNIFKILLGMYLNKFHSYYRSFLLKKIDSRQQVQRFSSARVSESLDNTVNVVVQNFITNINNIKTSKKDIIIFFCRSNIDSIQNLISYESKFHQTNEKDIRSISEQFKVMKIKAIRRIILNEVELL